MTIDPARKPNRRWIWYFALLAGLTMLATTILIVYNLRQQLKPEQLAAARRLWEEKRPTDYVLTYSKKGSASGTFVVTVRHGKVVGVLMREELVKDHEVHVVEQPLERRLYKNYDMNGLFDDMERFLEMDGKKDSPATYIRAVFDPKNGQLRWFVRRVMGTRTRIEIEVEPIQPLPPAPVARAAPGESQDNFPVSRAAADAPRLACGVFLQLPGCREKAAHVLAAVACHLPAKNGIGAGAVVMEVAGIITLDGELIR